MMKKLIRTAAVTTGILLSSQAFAAGIAFSNSSTEITPLNCEALDNNITVQLSKDVTAAFNCDASSFEAAACHSSGTNKNQTLTCLYYQEAGVSPASFQPLPGYSACPAYDANADPVPSIPYTGRIAFGGASGGGRVTAIPLASSTTCDTTSILLGVPDAMLDSQTSTATAL